MVEKSFESVLIEQCAPTLAGMKPANMFIFKSCGRRAVYAKADCWSCRLEPYGIAVCILKECGGSFLVYVYRKAWLDRIIKSPMISSFLTGIGYDTVSSGIALTQLSDRLCLKKEFPHEIGIFLGYPFFDVLSFIENNGRNYVFCGYWKAYFNPSVARKRTDQYKKCAGIYKRMFESGTPIMRLIVAA
mgnify:FL=1